MNTHQPTIAASDIDTGAVDGLKVLDPDGRLEKRTDAPQQKSLMSTAFRRLEIEHELKLDRLQHRKLGGFRGAMPSRWGVLKPGGSV